MWFDKYPERLEEETEILTGRGFVRNDTVFQEHKIVRFEGHSLVEPARRLIVCFPDTFPSFPAQIFDTPESPLLSRHHRQDTRQLCLFGPGNARWNAARNVDAALTEAEEIIAAFGPGKEPPPEDTVPEPTSAVLAYGASQAVFVPPPISVLASGTDRPMLGTFTLQVGSPVNGRTRSVVTAATLGSKSYQANAGYDSLGGSTARTVHGKLMFFPSQPTQGEVYQIVRQHFEQLDAKQQRRGPMLALVFPEQSGTSSGQRIGWVFATINREGALEYIRAFPYDDGARAARIPSLTGINAAKVTFVGCGCLGSKIAVSLAASGLGALTLIDGDIFEPYNSVRHEVGVPSFGLGKVEALAQRILDVNSGLHGRVKMIAQQIGHVYEMQVEREIMQSIADADLVIDTTGSHQVSRWINETAFGVKTPVVFASVTNGAWGGEVVRAIPGQTACWLCWNAQYRATPPPSAPTAGFFPPGCNQPSFTGTTYDAAVVASFASSMAVDTLLGNTTTLVGYPRDYIRWEGRDSAGIPVLKSELLPVNQRDGCSTCHAQRDRPRDHC